jgi:N-acyl-D-amino-acid deacylase
VREGYHADLVLFDADTIRDAASFTDPMQPAHGIDARLGQRPAGLSRPGQAGHQRTPGRFLARKLQKEAGRIESQVFSVFKFNGSMKEQQ